MTLVVGHAYILHGIVPEMWGVGHPLYGRPLDVAGRYLGSLQGERLWHGFEIRAEGHDVGVIFMHDGDIAQLGVEDLGA